MTNNKIIEVWFVSDVHLKNKNDSNLSLFCFFLQFLINRAKKKPIALCLLGDIFDLWVGNHKYFIEKFYPLIEKIKKIKSLNVPIYYVEGNHDFHLKSFWQDELKCQVIVDNHTIKIGSKLIRIEHGDLLDLDNKRHILWKKFMRSKFIKILSAIVPGSIVAFIGSGLSFISRNKNNFKNANININKNANNEESKQNNNIYTLKKVRRNASRIIHRNSNLSVLVCGHSHIKDEYSYLIKHKKIRFFNLGSWENNPMVLKIDSKEEKFFSISELMTNL